jgi:hypothetical protein
VVATIRGVVVRTYALAFLLPVLAAAPAAAATHTVAAGGDLQAALNAAQPGDVVELAPGATYIGNFKLPVKNGDMYIVVRTAAAAWQLPGPGRRVGPEHAMWMAKIKSPNTAAAMTTTAGAHHWRLELIEFQANAEGRGDIIVLGGSGNQTSLLQMPRDLILDRLYIHGDPLLGQKRGVALNSGATHIVNSYIADIKSVGQDSQAIAGWNGSGPYLIENNYLEGAGENILFGGADPSIQDLVPSDITIRRNYVSKPLAWRQEKWQVKNALELKSARRVLIEGNIFEHVWVEAQVGFAILFSTRNQDGRGPWAVVEDVTFQYNIVRRASNAINISGTDYLHPSLQGRRYRISHNIFHDIGTDGWGGKGIFLQIGNEPRDIIVEHNTVDHSGMVISVYGTRNGAPIVNNGFIFRGNLLRHNTYGVKGEATGVGSATLDAFFSDYAFELNALAGGKASRYPAGNYFPTVEQFETSFVNPAEGNFSLVPGSAFFTAGENGTALGADINGLLSIHAGQ